MNGILLMSLCGSAFSFLNLSERFDLEYYKKVPATYSALLEEYSGTEAEKIVRQHRWDENIGRLHTTEIIQNLENELHEVGVRLTEKQQDMLMQLIVQYHNGSRLWCCLLYTSPSPRDCS